MQKANNKKLYIDEKSYNFILEKIQKTGAEQNQNTLLGRSVYKAGTGVDRWDNGEFQTLESQNEVLADLISRDQYLLENAIVLKNDLQSDAIDFEDIVRINMIFSEEASEEVIIKLVGTTHHDFHSEYQETSINSPVGTAVYKRKIGEIVPCQIGNSNCNIEILEKLNKKTEPKVRKRKTDKK